MDKIKGILAALILSVTISTISYAGEWAQDESGWRYYNDDGSYEVNTWQWIDGNGDGVSEKYYFNEDGYCLINTMTPDGSIVDSNGALVVDQIVQTQPAQIEPIPAESNPTEPIPTQAVLTQSAHTVNKKEDLIGNMILCIFLLGALIAFCFFIRLCILERERRKKGIYLFRKMIHMGGLNSPRGCKCIPTIYPDHLSIVCQSYEYVIKLSQINSVDYQVDWKEIPFTKTVNGNVITELESIPTDYVVISYQAVNGNMTNIILRDEYREQYECSRFLKTITPLINYQINRVQL